MVKKSEFDALPLKEKINRLIPAYNLGLMSMYISHGGKVPHEVRRTRAYGALLFFGNRNSPSSFKNTMRSIDVYGVLSINRCVGGTLRALFPYIKPFLPISRDLFVKTFKRMLSYIQETRTSREANRTYKVKKTDNAGYVIWPSGQIIRANSEAHKLLVSLLRRRAPAEHPARSLLWESQQNRDIIYLIARHNGVLYVKVGYTSLLHALISQMEKHIARLSSQDSNEQDNYTEIVERTYNLITINPKTRKK